MKLIFLHGPPAAGKLTVAKRLADRTSLRLFHNHYTHNLAESIFDFGTEEFFRLCDELRLLTFEAAAKAKLAGLIFTFAYTNDKDDEFITRTKTLLAPYHSEICFVYLCPSVDVLEQRIVSENRRKYGKAGTVQGLHRLLKMYDYTKAAKLGGLSIDNSNMEPERVAQAIISHFQLP